MKANITVMNSRKLQVRALDSKLATFHMENLVPRGQSIIRIFRTALGMTATQLAARLGISQPRVIKMEQNERNLKLSTMENIASAMSCRFVYAFVPEKSIEQTVKLQAEKKSKKDAFRHKPKYGTRKSACASGRNFFRLGRRFNI